MDGKLVTSSAVRELCGGISDMTIWRWLNDPELEFPKPLRIGKRRYWKKSELSLWLKKRAHEEGGAL